MYTAVSRAARPVVATAAAAAAAVSPSPAGQQAARSEALRPFQLLPSEVVVEDLTVFNGEKTSSPPSEIGSWAVVDSLGDITDEEVREVVFPVLSHGALLHRTSDTDSDDTEPDRVIAEADNVIRSVRIMANDRTIRDALFANPEMHKLILQLKKGPITLLPPIAVDHTEPTTVTVEELPAEGGQRKILALFAAGLRSVGNHVTGAFGSFGDFFKALSSKSTDKQQVAGDEKAGSWEETTFGIILGLVAVVLIALAAKRLPR